MKVEFITMQDMEISRKKTKNISEDLEYFRQKLSQAIKIPKEFLGCIRKE